MRTKGVLQQASKPVRLHNTPLTGLLCVQVSYIPLARKNNPENPQARRIKRKSSGCGSRIHQQARAPSGEAAALSNSLCRNRVSHSICILEGQPHGGANIKAIPW